MVFILPRFFQKAPGKSNTQHPTEGDWTLEQFKSFYGWSELQWIIRTWNYISDMTWHDMTRNWTWKTQSADKTASSIEGVLNWNQPQPHSHLVQNMLVKEPHDGNVNPSKNQWLFLFQLGRLLWLLQELGILSPNPSFQIKLEHIFTTSGTEGNTWTRSLQTSK